MKKLISISVAMILSVIAALNSNAQWENLIKKDLSNWAQLNGTAPYKIEKGVITGTTVINSPNSFLCTKDTYGDFILEFDVLVHPEMNSGVQIRSESSSSYNNGRVHGYQVEIDPSPNGWTSAIYDEARRGWLYTLEKNPAVVKAFKNKEWNHIRIEAIGNSIRTWLNGVPGADLIDDMTPSGFIALQVHSIGNDATKTGEEVKWKNIKIITKNPEKYATPYKPVIPQVSFLSNTLTDREKNEGWKLLFDGKTSAGWINAKTGKFPVSGWDILNGALTVNPETKGPNGGGDIVTVDKFKNFELIVDFNYAIGANSGIKYFIDIEKNNGSQSSIGCEYQVLDDRNHPDAKEGINGNRKLAGLYDLIPPKNVRDNGADQWNRATIIVKGNHVEHWLNGAMTVSYERNSEEWKAVVATSKFKNTPGFAQAVESRILLQEHGNKVSFKNIRIREIKD
jgi:hypothetical protein